MEDLIMRIQLRFNPKASIADAMVVAGLKNCRINPPALMRVLLMNYFARQTGGIALLPGEQAIIAEIHPRAGVNTNFSQKDPKTSTEVRRAEKTDVADGPTPVASEPDPATPKGTTANDTRSEIIWSKENPPPCLDLSDFDPRNM